jgi:tight adherence protein B
MLWLLTAFAAFATLATLYLAAVERAAAQRRTTVDRVGRAIGGAVSAAAVDSILKETQSDLGNLLSGAAKRYKTLRELELLLYRAGSPMTLVRLLAMSAGLGIAGALLGSLAGYGPLPAVLGAGPILAVKRMKKKRLKTFDEQFPAALGLFSRALRAGHSMTSALQMVGGEMADPVGPEFALVSREISLGLSPAVAMANLQARMDAQDLPVFVTAVLVQLEAGGNLAETLDNLGEVVRQRLLFYGKVKALTAQAGASANILVVVPFAIFGVLRSMNPAFVEPMLNQPVGRLMLGAAACMVIVGWFACRKVARVDV